MKEESIPKLEEYQNHLDVLGERSSYSKTDRKATFMRMKEDAMHNGNTKAGIQCADSDREPVLHELRHMQQAYRLGNHDPVP